MPYPIILHHFDESPFSEKIRVIFGFKGLSWASVRIPRIMPKPDLMPLTGGYRRTPVMQIGADVFCDTQIIIREIERRFPSPTLFPSGMPASRGRSACGPIVRCFKARSISPSAPSATRFRRNSSTIAACCVAAGSTSRRCGRPFRRCAIRFAPISAGSRRSSATGGQWLLGDFSLADVSAYMNVWYVRSSLVVDGGSSRRGTSTNIFAGLTRIAEWESRMRAVGHGSRARKCRPERPSPSRRRQARRRSPGGSRRSRTAARSATG